VSQHSTMQLPIWSGYTLCDMPAVWRLLVQPGEEHSASARIATGTAQEHGYLHGLVPPYPEISVNVHPAPALQPLPERTSIASPALVSAVLNQRTAPAP
jgi:hypothetical protein